MTLDRSNLINVDSWSTAVLQSESDCQRLQSISLTPSHNSNNIQCPSNATVEICNIFLPSVLIYCLNSDHVVYSESNLPHSTHKEKGDSESPRDKGGCLTASRIFVSLTIAAVSTPYKNSGSGDWLASWQRAFSCLHLGTLYTQSSYWKPNTTWLVLWHHVQRIV